MASYANMLGENIGLGGNIKFAIENVANENISGLAFDAGICYHEAKANGVLDLLYKMQDYQ